MGIKVGAVVDSSAKALGLTTEEFLEGIEALTTPPKARSEFSKRMTIDYTAKSQIRCSWQFASAVLDYLYLHHHEVRDSESLKVARRDCMKVLTDAKHRLKRFSYFATDILPASGEIDSLVGAYAIVRHDTGDDQMRQDLLILQHSGTAEKAGRTLATYLTPHVVVRGVWGISENTLFITGYVRREDFAFSIATLEFALPADTRQAFGGILCGTSSIEGYPVVLPLLAIQIPGGDSRERLQTLCDRPDARLRTEFTSCGAYAKEPEELKAILDSIVLNSKKRFVEARDFVLPLRVLKQTPQSLDPLRK